jgi:cytochrome c-type biogenesis protein CcmE
VAEEVLAKHDENYMPPEVAESLKPHMDAANNAPENTATAPVPAPGST